MNFEKRRRKLSAFLTLAANLLVDEYGNNDYPIIIPLIKTINDLEEDLVYSEFSEKDTQDLLVLFICLVLKEYQTDEKYFLQKVADIDIDTKNRILRISGMPGQLPEEQAIAIERDPICKEMVKIYPYFKERLLEAQNRDHYQIRQ